MRFTNRTESGRIVSITEVGDVKPKSSKLKNRPIILKDGSKVKTKPVAKKPNKVVK